MKSRLEMNTPALITDIKVEENAEQLNAEQRILELCAQNPDGINDISISFYLFIYFLLIFHSQ
jgi:hypothetical protein